MPSVPPGGLILVIGANGYIASVTIQVLLEHGYRVRGTVRAGETYKWMLEYYGPKFQLVEVPDINDCGAFDEALKDVDGIAQMAMNMALDPYDLTVIDKTIKSTISILQAAAREPSVKSVVWTSSMSACNQQAPGTPYEINLRTVNTWAIEEAKKPWNGEGHPTARGILLYAAAKACAEQAAWNWMKTQNPQFRLNVVFPDANWGTAVSPENMGYKSTAALIESLDKGLSVAPAILPARWFVNVEDTSLIHMAALTMDEIENDRLFAAAGPYSWTEILEILHRRYPQRKSVLQSVDETDFDCGKIDTTRTVEILKKLGKDGFTSLEDTIVKAMDKIIECESENVPKSWVDLLLESVLKRRD